MSAETLASHLRELDGGDLLAAVHYEGDDYETVARSGDLAAYADDEFEEMAKHFVLKGFDDPLEQPDRAGG